MLKFIKSILIINILIIIFSVSASAAPKCELNLNNLKLGLSQANGFEKTDFMLDFKKQF